MLKRSRTESTAFSPRKAARILRCWCSLSSPRPMRYLYDRFLTERGFEVVCLNGSMDMEERKRVQDAFATGLSACDVQAGERLDVLRARRGTRACT